MSSKDQRKADDAERARLRELDLLDPLPGGFSRVLRWTVQQETGLEIVKATLAHFVRLAERTRG